MRPLFCLFLGFSHLCMAQTPDSLPFSGGLLFEDQTYAQLPLQSAEDGSKADLPAVVDLTPYCPEVRHQGYIFSCVGWAVGYSALSIQRALINRCKDQTVITNQAHSALFLYNQIKPEDCQNGSRISDALALLTDKGDCLARQFDFEVNNCEQLPDSNVAQSARRFAIRDYLALFELEAPPALKVLRVKKALAAQKPVMVGMSVRRNFYNLKQAQYWHPDLGNTAPAGGHAMTVVGYDDQKGAFRLMNSWGKAWGDNGFIWIKYEDFGQFCKYAYVLYLLAPPAMGPATTPERPLNLLSASLRFDAYVGRSEHTRLPIFEPAAAALNSAMPQWPRYVLERQDWPINQLFQLCMEAEAADQYVYVFSVDAERAVHFHWPRQAGLNEKFEGKRESALLASGHSEVVIPGPEKALKLAEPGQDHLIVLVSKQKIDNIKSLAALLSKKDGDLTRNLWQILGKFAVPMTDVHYQPNRIAFEASTRSEGWIVPLVLEVQAH